MAKLTPKQKRFCDEYLIDSNAKQAAIRAGYTPKTATVQGSRLLTYANVKTYIAERQQKVAEKAEISATWVLNQLKNVVEICTSAVPVMTKVNGELVESGDYKIDSYGANKALELIGKHLGMFVEKSDINLNASGELAAAIVRELSRNGNS